MSIPRPRILAVLIPWSLALGGLAAQAPQPVERSWAPESHSFVQLAAGDVDGNLRDDVLLLTEGGTVVLGYDPALFSAFSQFGALSGVQDLAVARSTTAGEPDHVLTVDNHSGLAAHVLQSDGTVVTTSAGLADWIGATQIQAMEAFGQTLVAGLDADGMRVHLARYTTTFQALATVTFTEVVHALEVGYYDLDTLPDVVALTASGLRVRAIDGTTLPGHGASGPPGAIARIGDSRFVWVRSQGGGPHLELVEISGMLSTMAVSLTGFPNAALDTMSLTGIATGHVDLDNFVDVVLGQTTSPDLVVLHGSASGFDMANVQVLPRPMAPGLALLDVAPPVVAQLDNHRQLGIVHTRHGKSSLGVTFDTEWIVQQGSGSDEPFIPERAIYDIQTTPPAGYESILELPLHIPSTFYEVGNPDTFPHVQITVWNLTGTHDPVTDEVTTDLATVEADMVDDFYWILDDAIGGDATHWFRVPLREGGQHWADRAHIVLMARFGRIDTVNHIVEEASWTFPFVLTMRKHDGDMNFNSFVDAWFANPEDHVKINGVGTNQSRNIGGIRRIPPVPPPIHGPPKSEPLQPQGTTHG